MATGLQDKFSELTSMKAFYALVNEQPHDTCMKLAEDAQFSPLVRDFAVALTGMTSPDAQHEWKILYDNRYDLSLLRFAMKDHNNPDVAVQGYRLNITSSTGARVLEAVYTQDINMKDGYSSRQFIVDAHQGGREAEALHRDFFRLPQSVFEEKLKQKMAATPA